MFSTPRHGEVRGVRTPWEGTFFGFFSGSVRAPNRFPGLATRGGGEGGILDRESRSVTATLASTANGFAETRHRSSSRSSLALDRIPIADRVRAELASNLARSASTWHKDQHGIDSDHGSILSTPPHDLRSLGAIANFVRRSRKFFRELDRSPIAARSVRPRKLGHIRSRECYERLRSILIDLRIQRPRGKNFRGSHRRINRSSHHFFRSFDRKKRVSEGPLTPLPTKSSRERFFSVRPLTPRIANFSWG
jgi:hypothetical protein